jgi:cephalosporin hydroxylase
MTLEVEALVNKYIEKYSSRKDSIASRPEQLIAIAKILEKLSSYTQMVVEIGTRKGQAAVFVGEVLRVLGKPNLVLSIDPFTRESDYFNYVKNRKDTGLQHKCSVLVGRSEDVASLICNDIGFLIVDGNHGYESVKRDLELYVPKVQSGGFIFIDDYFKDYPGVIKAAKEYFSNDNGHTQFFPVSTFSFPVSTFSSEFYGHLIMERRF